MHTMYSVIYPKNFTRMYNKSKRFYKTTELRIKMPNKIKRPFRSLQNHILLKTSKMQKLCIFYGPIIMYKYAGSSMVFAASYCKKTMLTNTVVVRSHDLFLVSS